MNNPPSSSSNTSQLRRSSFISFAVWIKRVNSSERLKLFCHRYLYLHILIISFSGGWVTQFSNELSSLDVDMKISEWSNDRSLKSWRTLQSLCLCSSVKFSACRTRRNTWGPGSESLTQVPTCSFNLSWEILVSSRSGVLMTTICFCSKGVLNSTQQSAALSVQNFSCLSIMFPTALISDQLFPSRTTLSSDTAKKSKSLISTQLKRIRKVIDLN